MSSVSMCEPIYVVAKKNRNPLYTDMTCLEEWMAKLSCMRKVEGWNGNSGILRMKLTSTKNFKKIVYYVKEISLPISFALILLPKFDLILLANY